MKRFLLVFALLGVSCTKHELPSQDSYTITVTYRKCETNGDEPITKMAFGDCKLVSEDEKKRAVR